MRIFNSVIVITLLSFITASSAAQKPILFNEKFGTEASAIFPNAQHVWLKQENSVPAFIELRSGSETEESTFFFLLKKKFNLPSSYQFQLLDNTKDEIGWEHHRFQLYVNGVPVTNGIFITHLQNGKVKKFNGSLFKNISVSTSPTLSESAALASALKNLNASIYKWQLSEEEEMLKQMNGNAGATYFPKGQLEIVQSNRSENDFRLAWKFDVYAHEPMSRNEVFVDAETGEVLKKNSRIYNANTAGTAVTAYRGSRGIVADSYTGQYRLYETTRGLGVHTYNMQKGTNYGAAVEFLDANNIWSNVNANKDQYAGDAHWGGEMTYDFYQSMGRNSIDNAGYALNLYVHYNTNYVNAFWDGTRMTFGDGNATNNPLTSLDITGHEISHGLDELTANLTYQDEPGALNESFSDIFGTAVEWFADSTVANWTIGEDIGSPFRSMSNPNTYGDPDTYLGTNWYTGTGDNGGVHTNSNVQNFWYYLLSQGGTGTNDIGNAYTVTGISRHKATQIAWHNMVFYLTNNSQYADSRFYAIQSANDLFGTCSAEAIATTNAWYAVGVGAQFTFGVDAQFTASQTAGCQVPFVVNFTNTSTNASSYTWDFGDGTTSTAQAPSHTYTTLGNYTVRLISNGGACGIDSLIRTNYINISTSNPCVVVMPTTGTYQTQTSCTGTIYDSGGPTGNYTDNTNSVLTISPAGATQVMFHFTQFNMENTYDFLYVYDGPTTASPQIGAYTGTTIPADITSSGGSLTIRQTTDGGVVAAGYTIQWSCISPTLPPVANFKADVTSSCNGKINFTDLSTNGPTSWLWNFGDGGTSTLQNPSHTYFTNGTFTVSLKATNAYGNNTNTKNNYITIAKPAAPVAANASRCGNGTVSLSANSVDTIKWYANATDTTAVSVSNPFVTPSLSATTTYYAEDIVPGSTAHVGPVNDSIGAVSNYSNSTDRYLIFNCLAACTLKTVKVYAQGSGNRTIVLRDSTGAILQTLTLNLASGLNIVTLNFVLPLTNKLRLGINGTANLFRNTAGAVYPYTLAGLVSITGTNGTAGYYYYFYDWVIKSTDCVSLRKAVTATINPAVVASSSHTNVLCNGGNTGTTTVSASGGTPNFSYTWTGGATTTTANNLTAGTYNVTVNDVAGCSATSTQTIAQPTALSLVTIVTADTCNRLTGKVLSTINGGTTNYAYLWSNSQTTSSINNLPSGNFALTVTDANNCTISATALVNSANANLSLNATSTNVLCNGGNTGSATANITGGFPTVIYHWSNNASSSAISNLVAGNYSVTVTDGGGCSASAAKIITQPLALSLTTTTTADTCGRGTGKIISTVSGGTTNYSYLWGGSQTTSSINNLVAGNFTLTVTDANNCTTSATALVNSANANLSLNATSTTVLCNGGNTGSATANITGGFPTVIYHWSNNASSSAISNLAAGNYSVTVTDGGGCSVTATKIITQPLALSLTTTTTADTCGRGTGKIISTVSGGTTNYSYLWSNSQASASLNNLQSGNFTLTVTDANNCTLSATALVNSANANLSLNATSTNVLCNGGNTGSASANVTGGFPSVVYHWSNNASSSSLYNLQAGNYSVTVTDGGGCSATATKIITQPIALSLTTTTTADTCGRGTGKIISTVSGGTTTYSYLWSNSQASASLNNLPSGNFTLTVTDANNCTTSATAVVTAVSGTLSLATSSVNVLCNGGNTGSATANVTGGFPNVIYHWSNNASSSVISNLSAGNYTLTITDGGGCSVTASQNISEPSALNLQTSFTSTTCGNNNGTASVQVSGGVSGYSYLWSNTATTSSLNNLAAGNYQVTITDANSCTASANTVVNSIVGLSITSNSSNVLCSGGVSGSATVTVNSGIAPIIYSWSNGNSSALLSNVSAGNYSVTVSDANNCSSTVVFNITEPAALNISVTTVDATCVLNGSITTQISGGTSAYAYLWNTAAITSSLNNLSAGNYSVTITDANNCSASANAVVNNPVNLAFVPSSNNVLCFGDNSGNAAVSITSGTTPFVYNWSNGAANSSINNIAAGNYSVTVTDANSCSATSSFIITEPVSAIQTAVSSTNATCAGNDGTISLQVSGGTIAYTYAWSSGANTSALSNLQSGNYFVTVTDANACSTSTSVLVGSSGSVVLSATSGNTNCNGGNDGSADVVINSGAAPFVYSWSNGASVSSLTNLVAGVYAVTVVDANQCQSSASITVSEPTAITASGNVVEPLCAGNSSGNISLQASGGTGVYSYLWSNAGTTDSIQNISAGNYSVTVFDANNCSTSSSFSVNEPSPLSLTSTSTDAICFGEQNGTASLNVTGGTQNYSYEWCNGATTATAQNLAAGVCTVTITDLNNCTTSTTIHISQPNSLQVITSSANSTNGQSNGTVFIDNTSGGVAPYSYLWSTGDTTSSLSNLFAGTYTVTTTDANGCSVTASVVVQSVTGIVSANEDFGFSVFPNPATNEIFVELNKLSSQTILSLKNVLGQNLFFEIISATRTKIDLSLLAAGVYMLELKQGDKKLVKEIVVCK